VVVRVYLCDTVSGGSCENERAWTLDAKELSHFQRCAAHLREFGYEARQVRFCHHEGRRGLGGVGGCSRAAE
jgi:hypothetical protein